MLLLTPLASGANEGGRLQTPPLYGGACERPFQGALASAPTDGRKRLRLGCMRAAGATGDGGTVSPADLRRQPACKGRSQAPLAGGACERPSKGVHVGAPCRGRSQTPLERGACKRPLSRGACERPLAGGLAKRPLRAPAHWQARGNWCAARWKGRLCRRPLMRMLPTNPRR